MEEKTKNQKPAKLSYDELNKAASELHVQYQKLTAEFQKLRVEYDKAVEALKNRDFDYTSMFLQMLFKVVEHPEMYDKTFTDWAIKNIQGALVGFVESMKGDSDAPVEETKKEDNEAE